MIMTMFLFMKRVSETTEIKDLVAEDVFDENTTHVLEESNDKILVYQVNGPLFFGVVQSILNKIKNKRECYGNNIQVQINRKFCKCMKKIHTQFLKTWSLNIENA